MDRGTERVFHLIETADNFIKYAKQGGEARAAERARKRYMKAAQIADAIGNEEMLQQVRLRLVDLERRASLPTGVSIDDTEVDPPELLTSALPEHADNRVPRGQRVTRGWPVLHEGGIPRFDPETWLLESSGECEEPLSLSYDELKSLDVVQLKSDFHCVTGWSKLDNLWTGVRMATLLEMTHPSSAATHVSVQAAHGYDANVPLEVLRHDDVLVAWGHNGADLQPKHGYPLRLVIPTLYAWKSVKWVRNFEFLAGDRRGFWELRGYHNRADPWREERYSYQEV